MYCTATIATPIGFVGLDHLAGPLYSPLEKFDLLSL